MANTKTQKQLKIAKTKSESIVNWFVNEAHWKILSDNLDLGKTAVFRYKKNIKEIEQNEGSFEALAEILTLKQLNTVITIYNDAVEHPEKYEKPRKKSEIDLEDQAEKVQRHMKDMNMDYLSYNKEVDEPKKETTEEKVDESTEKGATKPPKKEVKASEDETPNEVIARQSEEIAKAREEINALPVGSKERAEKEAEFQSNKANHMKEYWDAQKRQEKNRMQSDNKKG